MVVSTSYSFWVRHRRRTRENLYETIKTFSIPLPDDESKSMWVHASNSNSFKLDTVMLDSEEMYAESEKWERERKHTQSEFAGFLSRLLSSHFSIISFFDAFYFCVRRLLMLFSSQHWLLLQAFPPKKKNSSPRTASYLFFTTISEQISSHIAVHWTTFPPLSKHACMCDFNKN